MFIHSICRILKSYNILSDLFRKHKHTQELCLRFSFLFLSILSCSSHAIANQFVLLSIEVCTFHEQKRVKEKRTKICLRNWQQPNPVAEKKFHSISFLFIIFSSMLLLYFVCVWIVCLQAKERPSERRKNNEE